ncbi:MAG: LLM class flavin-dependent oxidoreductase [Rhodospirillaceae bacterium]|nr:LLM class flavin-dependent oxidoreductase [Rhodospirillaceae bacterium]
MRFGYFSNTANLGLKKPFTQILDETRKIATCVEDAGWESIWFTEHHFGHEGYEVCPNPIMMSADIAARTTTLRIGQAANIVTYWNPVRLAEDIAMLDHMSNGRIEVGVGRGIYGREAIHLNKDADLKDQAQNFRLFEQTMAFLKKAWSQEFVDHDGEFFTYPEPGFTWNHAESPKSANFMNMETNELEKIAIVPRPLQQPHPPLWQVVDGAGSIQWAAENGLGAMMWIPTVESLKWRFEMYREKASEAQGKDVPLGEGVALVRDMFCAETMEDAKIDGGEGILSYLRWVCHFRGLGNHMDPGEELPETPGKLDLLSYDWLHPRNLLFGTPDYIAERIEELRDELGLETLLLWSNFPGVPHDKVMRSIQLFNEEVLPRFQPGTVKLAV